jgi:hypothetical protein
VNGGGSRGRHAETVDETALDYHDTELVMHSAGFVRAVAVETIMSLTKQAK